MDWSLLLRLKYFSDLFSISLIFLWYIFPLPVTSSDVIRVWPRGPVGEGGQEDEGQQRQRSSGQHLNQPEHLNLISVLYYIMLFSDLARVGVIIVASPVAGNPT